MSLCIFLSDMSNKETDYHVLKLLFTPLLVPPFFPCIRVRQDISLVTLWPCYATVAINCTGQDTVVLMSAASV